MRNDVDNYGPFWHDPLNRALTYLAGSLAAGAIFALAAIGLRSLL